MQSSLMLFAFLVATFTAAALGSLYPPGEWYADREKGILMAAGSYGEGPGPGPGHDRERSRARWGRSTPDGLRPSPETATGLGGRLSERRCRAIISFP